VPVFTWDSSYQQLYACVKAIEDLIDPTTVNPKEKISASIQTSDMFIKMLGQIKGLNENKLAPLKIKYGSIKNLSKATIKEIQESDGIGKTLAEKIYRALN
jgi:ERCC4-type nuclease